MRKRFSLAGAALVFLALWGCNKTEGNKPQNFFGAPPQVSEVLITKERKHFQCLTSIDLCCVDPPLCTCCCIPDTINQATVDIDLVTASAKVVDPTGSADILVVVLRFLDPPSETVPSGTQVNQISLEMFDAGTTPAGQVLIGGNSFTIFSGDQVAGDSRFTRKFYFGSSTSQNAGTCVEETDTTNQGGTFSTYSTAAGGLTPSTSLSFHFTVQAIDKSGNIDTSSEAVLPIQGTFREQDTGQQRACGAPTGNGGCVSGP